MYLCAGLKVGETEYPMAGVFEASTVLCPKPQGLGYVEVETVLDTPFFPKGTRLRGHEFHYSRCVRFDADHGPAFAMKRGVGLGKGPGGLNQDGLFRDATLAAYTHIHASGVPGWAESFVAAARRRMRGENASL
jgi:cobyrinic acid a,c-diamide synthase